jgi:drug/metabolite transporter (DMT)-like permease
MQTRLPNAGDYGLLLLLAAIWGSSFVFIKVAVVEVPPVTLTTVRLLSAAAVLLGVCLVTARKLPAGRAAWLMMVASAVLGNALPFSLISWGQQVVPAGTAAILMGIMPLMTLVLAHLFTHDDKLNGRKFAGMLTGFVGLCVLVGPAALGGLTVNLLSQLAILGAATCYACNAVVIRRLDAPDKLAAVAVIVAISAVLILPMAFAVEQPLAVEASLRSWSLVTVLGVLHTALATLIMFSIVARAGASFFGQLNLLVPMAGVMWGAVLLGEVPGVNALAALALIVSGIVIARGGLGLGQRLPAA